MIAAAPFPFVPAAAPPPIASLSEPVITLTDVPSHADFLTIYRALDKATAPVAGPFQPRPLVLLLHDKPCAAPGSLVGGLWGRTAYSWLTIEMLIVPSWLRGRGIGSRLVADAEAEARARGCIGVQVASFDFQAPRFYMRHGFTVIGVQQDLPPGHRQIYLQKRLDEAADDASRESGTSRDD